MKNRVYIASSLDGYIASGEGSVDWLEPFFGEDYGYDAFAAGIACAVMGRATYDEVLGFGDWPHPELPVYVLSRTPLEEPPPGVVAWPRSTAELLAELGAIGYAGDCWVIGGGRTIREFQRLEAIDEYEIFLMPVFLGEGIRLFPSPAPAAPLELVDASAWENGVVRLLYRAPRGTQAAAATARASEHK